MNLHLESKPSAHLSLRPQASSPGQPVSSRLRGLLVASQAPVGAFDSINACVFNVYVMIEDPFMMAIQIFEVQ